MTEAPLIDRLIAGDPRALARAITIVEDEQPAADAILARAHRAAGQAVVIGITGPPGAGKSTLVDRIVAEWRRMGQRVAVLAVDPSSPFTGGAILGDRVRMQAHAADTGVFIRSMATRGHLGGLARATADVATLCDAAGFHVVLIETVGVGQDEVDIARTADVSIVVGVPGAGDEVQALKAGVMEIADLFVINKADRDGADQAAAAIEAMLSLDDRPGDWRPPVLRAVATTGAGVPEIVSAIDRFRAVAPQAVARRRRARSDARLRDAIGHLVRQAIASETASPQEWDTWIDRIESRTIDPRSVAADWMVRLRGGRNGRLDHIGVATDNEAATLNLLTGGLGLTVDEGEDVATQAVRVRFVDTGDAKIEVIVPTSAESPLTKHLAKRGPGLHHVAIRVTNLAATLSTLKTRGVRLIDDAPRPGAHGTQVAFIHPSSAHGVLVELVERQGSLDVDR